MAAKFSTLVFHAPDPVVRDNTAQDAFVMVDEAVESARKKASGDIGIDISKISTAACTKASGDIDWLPQHLKDRVDQHRPKEGDINMGGYVKKCRLSEEAKKLFEQLQNEIAFVNFYQLKQMLQRFAGYWGFTVSTQDSLNLVCFFTKTSRKPRKVLVSPPEPATHGYCLGRISPKVECMAY
jgi:hypothetical protein